MLSEMTKQRVLLNLVLTIMCPIPKLRTVCKSLRNSINVTKPAPIPIGAKLIHASSWPNRSPATERFTIKIRFNCTIEN